MRRQALGGYASRFSTLEMDIGAALAAVHTASLAMSASIAFDDGLVIVAELPEIDAEAHASSVGVLPVVQIGIAPCVALWNSGGNDGRRAVDADPWGQ